MNDKIKGLVEQAILDVDIVYEDNILNEELAKMYIPHCFAEMFAELIIREHLIVWEMMDNGNKVAGYVEMEDYPKAIIKHFGYKRKK